MTGQTSRATARNWRLRRTGAAACAALALAFAASQPASTAPPELPSPFNPSQAEREHTARLDKAIAPLANYKLSAGDAQRLRDALRALSGAKVDVAEANAIKQQIEDATARKLVDWFRLRKGFGTPAEYRAFLDANPAWGDRTTLTQKFEEVLFTQGGSSGEIKSAFAGRAPQNGVGLAALASAHLAEGNKDEARRLAAQAWRETMLPASLEPGFLARFGALLTEADHKWRLDRLLLDDIRWQGEKKQRAAIVRRVIALLPPAEQKKAQARLSVFMGSKSHKEIEALPAERVPDWGLAFHRIQALRRAGKNDEAAKLLLSAPTEEAVIVSPDAWWIERRANAYAALRLGNPKLAYALVREAGPLSVNPLKEQAFMAGWLALRYLKDAKAAEQHFQVMNKASDGPLSRAKARYWLGRTAEARGDKAAADEYYRQALSDPDTFHALLARQKLEPGRLAITTSAPKAPTAEQIRRFVDHDAAKAVVIAKSAGLDASVMRTFLVQLRMFHIESEAELAMVAHLAEAVGDTQSAVRVAKAAIARGHNLYYYAYPVHPFPAYKPLRQPPETAFLLGLARQETEFNTLIVSGAGAKGLLQVMTVTAKHVCRDYKIKCDIGRLTSDPSYNTMLASAYVADRMQEFQGSYILTLAGYNAGPGRARQWIREFGDPRNPKVDPIDWIERIPIQETREYVGKVLANIQIYRARLGEEQAALRLEEDLNRARVAARHPGGKSDG